MLLSDLESFPQHLTNESKNNCIRGRDAFTTLLKQTKFRGVLCGGENSQRRKENTLSRRARCAQAATICEGIKSINNIADSEWKFCSQAFVPYFNVWTPLGLVMGACNVCRQWLKAHGKITLTSRPSAFYSQLWAAAASGFHKPNSFFPLPYFSFHLYAQHLFLLEMRSLFSLCWIERDAAAAAGWSAPVGCSPLIYDSACHLLLFDFSRPDRMHTPWAPHIENVFTASTSGGINPSAFINIFI